jgi:SAM-dependent methyltransferase
MKRQALNWLACPVCRTDLRLTNGEFEDEIEEGRLSCAESHVFPIVRGVPRLLTSQQLAASGGATIAESFSREWTHFDYDLDRTWGQTVEQRRLDFLRHVDRTHESLVGKVVLDAGCGNGALSVAISTFGCEVVATDISGSVEGAYQHFRDDVGAHTHFVQSDLMNPAVRPAAFDVVYCAGVLHHTPNTRRTFDTVLTSVAPGGSLFVWLYWRVPGLHARLSEIGRQAISPLPAALKHAVVWLLVPPALLRNRIRAARGRTERLNTRELTVRMLDSYTPRYRWVHTPEEAHAWFREHGFDEIKTTEEGREGFGVVARRPAA